MSEGGAGPPRRRGATSLGLKLGWGAVGKGAGVALALAIPTWVVLRVLMAAAHVAKDSNWWFVGFALFLVEMGFGGAVAADARPDDPLTHGGLAGLVAFSPVLVAVLVSGIATSAADQVARLLIVVVFYALMFGSAGIIGAMVASRPGRRRRTHRHRHRRAHSPRAGP